ncbi:hypothetical protein BBC0244_018050 [Bartonella apihabitans]|nr:hypothetical protein BBC0244_018050 [Bartonella apihabitans]
MAILDKVINPENRPQKLRIRQTKHFLKRSSGNQADCFRVFTDRIRYIRGFPALLSSLKLCNPPEPRKFSVGCPTAFSMPAEFYCSGIVDLKPFTNGAQSVASTSLAFSMPVSFNARALLIYDRSQMAGDCFLAAHSPLMRLNASSRPPVSASLPP